MVVPSLVWRARSERTHMNSRRSAGIRYGQLTGLT
jgi:hypothetical protein